MLRFYHTLALTAPSLCRVSQTRQSFNEKLLPLRDNKENKQQPPFPLAVLASNEENSPFIKSITPSKTPLPSSIKAPCTTCCANTCYVVTPENKRSITQNRNSRGGIYTPQTPL